MADVKMGIKIGKDEEMDAKLGGSTVLPSATAEVEGQEPYRGVEVLCPWCGARLRGVIVDKACFKWFTCSVCGRVFRY